METKGYTRGGEARKEYREQEDGEKSEKGGGAGKEIRTRGKEKFGKELKRNRYKERVIHGRKN